MTCIKNLILIIVWFVVTYFMFLFQPYTDFETYVHSLIPKHALTHLDKLYTFENSDLFHLYLTTENDTSLSAYLKVPHDSKQIPAILVLGGMQTGKYAVNYAYGVNNVVIAAPDYRYKPRLKYNLISIFSDISEAYNSTYFQIVDNLLLIDFLKKWEKTKKKNIGILGYSFGVPFAAATARFNCVNYLALVYGGGDLRFLLKHNLKLYNWYMDYLLANFFWLHVFNFEPVYNMQSVIPTPLIIINGKNDEKIPDVSARKLHESILFDKTTIWLDSKHVHPQNKQLSIKIIDHLNIWLNKNNFFE